MSDTTPTPRSEEPRSEEEPTPIADETARELATGEQPLVTSSDPADHTDTGVVPDLPPDYRPVSASEHVAPEPEVPATAESEPAADEPAGAEEPLVPEREDRPETAGEEPAPAADSTPTLEPVPTPVPAAAAPADAPVTEEPTLAPAAAEPTPTPYPEPVATPYPGPTYLQVPTAPEKRSNRGLGILIAVLAAVVFGAANLAATYGILLIRYGDAHALDYLEQYVKLWDFWLPLAVFTAAFIGLVAIVNRGRWWGYVLGSLFVAILVFAAFFAATLLDSRAWNFTPGEFDDFTHDYFETKIPYLWIATIVSVIALEAVIWFGAWISVHGQRAKRRNLEARAAYEAELEQTTAR